MTHPREAIFDALQSKARRAAEADAIAAEWQEYERRNSNAHGLYMSTLRPPASAFSDCGTQRGYDRHRKRGESTCLPCRKAHNDYQRGLTSPAAGLDAQGGAAAGGALDGAS